MAAKQVPLFLYSEFSKKVYIVTKYSRLKNGAVAAIEKHDVTEDFRRFAQRMAGEGII
jgi:hypothetical protein